MTAASADDGLDDGLDDLLPDDLLPKGRAVPVRRTPQQEARIAAREQARAAADALQVQTDAAKAKAAQLAQVVNLVIAGHSYDAIGAAIGASASEVERMLNEDTARYVRTQPALRKFVRDFISGKYSELLNTVWDRATDAGHKQNFDAQDRAIKILDKMSRLHGADAPTQTEIKVESAPEAVERLVDALARAQGLGYDTDIFSTVPGTVVHEAVEQSHAALEVSRNRVEDDQEGDGDLRT